MIEHVNEAVKILKARLKDAGIKGVDIQYYLGNGDAEYLILVFPNDINENGTPYYNKDIEDDSYNWDEEDGEWSEEGQDDYYDDSSDNSYDIDENENNELGDDTNYDNIEASKYAARTNDELSDLQ